MQIARILKDPLRADSSRSAILLCDSDHSSKFMCFPWNLCSWLLHLGFPLRAGCSPVFFYICTQKRGWSVPANQTTVYSFQENPETSLAPWQSFHPVFFSMPPLRPMQLIVSHCPEIRKSPMTFMKILKQGLSLISHRIKWKRSSAITFSKLINKGSYCSQVKEKSSIALGPNQWLSLGSDPQGPFSKGLVTRLILFVSTPGLLALKNKFGQGLFHRILLVRRPLSWWLHHLPCRC